MIMHYRDPRDTMFDGYEIIVVQDLRPRGGLHVCHAVTNLDRWAIEVLHSDSPELAQRVGLESDDLKWPRDLGYFAKSEDQDWNVGDPRHMVWKRGDILVMDEQGNIFSGFVETKYAYHVNLAPNPSEVRTVYNNDEPEFPNYGKPGVEWPPEWKWLRL